MKQFLNILALAMCTAALLCSCSKAKKIEVSEDYVTFAINGGEKTIDVTADGKYDIEDCPEWVKAVADESSLTLIVEKNTTGALREGVIRLVGNDVEKSITVRQADKCTYIRVSEDNVTIPKEGGEATLKLDTDGGNLTMNCPEGIEAVLKGRTLTISAHANQGGAIKGDLTISCENVSTTVKVTVEGVICSTCNGTGTITCTACGGRGYTEVTSRGDDRWFSEDYGCKKCGGYGYQSSEGYIGEYMKKGSGRITCPDCGGTGR